MLGIILRLLVFGLKGVLEKTDYGFKRSFADNIFIAQVLPSELTLYLPQSGTEALVSSEVLSKAKVVLKLKILVLFQVLVHT